MRSKRVKKASTIGTQLRLMTALGEIEPLWTGQTNVVTWPIRDIAKFLLRAVNLKVVLGDDVL